MSLNTENRETFQVELFDGRGNSLVTWSGLADQAATDLQDNLLAILESADDSSLSVDVWREYES